MLAVHRTSCIPTSLYHALYFNHGYTRGETGKNTASMSYKCFSVAIEPTH